MAASLSTPAPSPRATAAHGLHWLSRHWLLAFNVLWGLFVILPWLAPVFMHWGWTSAGNLLYLVYSLFCHQLPERSFFLFGSRPMYSLAEIQAAWQATDNPLILRQFIGNADLGWKVAWSDRMVSLYTSVWLGGLLYAPLRRRMKPLPLWIFLLAVVGMGLDGGTHFLSDLSGLEQGFRATNAWLAALTYNALPAAFYAGNPLGSFNSWMRLITGAAMGLGAAWLALPYLEAEMARGDGVQ